MGVRILAVLLGIGIFFGLMMMRIQYAQEAKATREMASEAYESVGLPYIQYVTATDGSELGITTVFPNYAACRRDTELYEQETVKRNAPDKWLSVMKEFEAKNACVVTREGDRVVVGPSKIPEFLAIRFMDRDDVRSALAFFVACEAIPQAEDYCLHE